MVHVIIMLMTLYCVAPEVRLLNRNWKSGEGFGRQRAEDQFRKKTIYLRFNWDGNWEVNSDINLQTYNFK